MESPHDPAANVSGTVELTPGVTADLVERDGALLKPAPAPHARGSVRLERAIYAARDALLERQMPTGIGRSSSKPIAPFRPSSS